MVHENLFPDVLRWRTEALSLRAIADRLNAAGHITRPGARWE